MLQVKSTFRQFDTDDSGSLDKIEFISFLDSLGVIFSADELLQFYSGLGENFTDSEAITFNDFWRYYSIGLPKGLVLDEFSGTISGSPESSTLPAIFIINCSNPVGEVSTELRIEIQEAPADLEYLCSDCLYMVGCETGFNRLPTDAVGSTLLEMGAPFERNILTYRGSKVSFTCNPRLPDGLCLDPSNGTISGIPRCTTIKKGKSGSTEPVAIKVTGRNEVAFSSVEIKLEVCKAPSTLKYKSVDSAYCIGEQITDNEVVHCDGNTPYYFTVARDPFATKQCFDKYDGDCSGSLDVSEFRKFLNDLGEKLSEVEFRWLVSQVDSDMSGSIEFTEFWEWWKPLPYGLELDEKTGAIYGRPLRRCVKTVFVVTVWNKVGSFTTKLKIQVLDEAMSRDREADCRRRFWYTGRRRMAYPNGDVYEGGWEGGKYHGKGMFTGHDGYQYEGEWRHGKRHGIGRESFPDGLTFDGDFVDNSRHGKGSLLWPDGCEYIGEFQAGKRGGMGRQIWKDGDGMRYEYNGAWEDDVMHGQGTVWEDGSISAVEARRGAVLLRVQSTLSNVSLDLPDGSKYSGEAKESNYSRLSSNSVGMWVPHGQGSRAWPSGETYDGEYREGLRDGRGRYVSANGTTYDGQWRKGHPALDGVLVEKGQASVVWHDASTIAGGPSQRRLHAPMVRVPVSSTDQVTLGLGADGRMPRCTLREDAPTQKQATQLRFPPVQQARGISVLSGYRDGSSLATNYVRVAREHSLPAVTFTDDVSSLDYPVHLGNRSKNSKKTM